MNDTPAEGAIRKIIHVDMDAFYASVEQRDNPELRGKPLAVGGGVRGVVAAASYEARKFGIRSAMPAVTARRLCPELIFVKPRFDAYRAVSQQIRAIFLDYTPHVEPLSLDEAYLDVTEDLKGIGIATVIAEEIRARIQAETGLTASAGVSYNKFLAKLASDQNKPDGLCVVTPARGPAFVEGLPVKRFHGVGPKTAEKMARLGIETGADLQGEEPRIPRRPFRLQRALLLRSRPRHLPPPGQGRPALQVGQRRGHVPHRSVGRGGLARRARADRPPRLAADRRRRRWPGGRSTSRSNMPDFQIVTRARSLDRPVSGEAEFLEIGAQLLRGIFPPVKSIRLLGLGLSNLGEEERRAGRPLELELPLA